MGGDFHPPVKWPNGHGGWTQGWLKPREIVFLGSAYHIGTRTWLRTLRGQQGAHYKEAR